HKPPAPRAPGAPAGPGARGAPAASGTAGSTRRRGNGLSGMLLPELQRLAGELGVTGTGRLAKGGPGAPIPGRQVGSGSAGDRPADSGPAGADSPATSSETSGTAASAAP